MDITVDSLLPELETFLRKSGLGKTTIKMYRTSLRIMLAILGKTGMGFRDMDNPDFLKEFFRTNTAKRKEHIGNLKKFLNYKGLLVHGTAASDTGMTIQAAQEDLFKALKRKGYREGTLVNYFYTIRDFVLFCGGREISTLSGLSGRVVSDYQAYLFTDGKERHCLNKKIHMLYELKVFFRHLFTRGYALIDLGAFIEPPRQEKKVVRNVFKREEIVKLLSVIDTSTLWGFMDRTMFEVLYGTGIRISELGNLAVGDIDFKQGTLMVREGKGAKDRTVPLTATAGKYLRAYMENVRPRIVAVLGKKYGTSDTGMLFLIQRGHRRKEDFILKVTGILRIYQEQAGFEMVRTCHAFRYSCATHMLENGASIRLIGELLGHNNLDTTGRYTRVSVKNMREAIGCHPRERESVQAAVHPKFRGKTNVRQGDNG